MRRAAWLTTVTLLLGALGACGDLTSSVGDQGRIELSITTDYEVSGRLDKVTLVGGHPQTVAVGLTNKGADDIAQPEDLIYRFEPSRGVMLELEDSVSGEAPDFTVLVRDAGTYRLRAIYKGEEVDSFDLRFDTPASLSLVVKVREPFASALEAIDDAGPTAVTEGAQATFLPIPLDDRGKRLVGSLQTRTTADPEELVVPGQSVLSNYENGVWTVRGPFEVYFIDPGVVTVTVTDPVSGAEGQHSFRVTDLVR